MWLARYYDAGFRIEDRLGLADDILDAQGTSVLDFVQAQESAVTEPGGYAVEQCCLEYLQHLDRRGDPDYGHTKYDLDAYESVEPRQTELCGGSAVL